MDRQLELAGYAAELTAAARLIGDTGNMGKGRKRKPGKREPNGRVARGPDRRVSAEQDVMSVAVGYRTGVLGVKAAHSLDQKAATLIGRLQLSGAVSEAQWQAGEDWLMLLNAMYAATNAPRGFKSAGASSVSPLNEEEESRRYRALKERFDAANAAVEDRAPVAERIERFKALRAFLVDQIDNPKMRGTLRMALNALAHHFGHQRAKAA
jgi:hypothetical protein